MKTAFNEFRRQWYRWGFLLFVAFQAVAAPTLDDFGYNSRRVNGHEARGGRPLLLIIASYDTAPPFANDFAYYDNLVFNVFSTNSINSYLLENSNGRFYWTRAGEGTVILTNLPASQRRANMASDELWYSNIVAQAMIRGLFDFSPFAADGLTVREGDMGISIVNNDHDPGKDGLGATRGIPRVQVGGSTVAVEFNTPGGSASFADNTTFNVGAHETCHTVGTVDIYGSEGVTVDQNLSIMADSIYGTIYHLDPWHKMQLGWVEPRIRSLRDGGVAILPPPQAIETDAPVILYDPLRFNPAGTNEFFIVEYRTQTSPYGSGYDRNVAGNGMVIWHVVQNEAKRPMLITINRAESGPYVGQAGWLSCDKCQGLFFNQTAAGPCPQDGGNHRRGSASYNNVNYMMVSGVVEPGRQSGWRYCKKCDGLFYGPNQAESYCPDSTGGPRHDATGSDNYSLVLNDLSAPGQHEWRWCQKCQGLFYGPNQSDSNCPKDNLQHDGSASSDYAMVRSLYHYSVFTAGAPDLAQGGNRVWGSEATTPYLSWLDGTPLPTRLYVRPFNIGDGRITVEWLSDGEIWVDFAYSGFFEVGTFDFPFNTFAEGTTAVPHGGTLQIKAGSSAETGTITKRMTIQAFGGLVNIGR